MTPKLPGLDPLAAHVHRKAVAVLRTRLQKAEPVLNASAATVGRREGILAATDRRLLFATKGVWRGKVEHFLFTDLRRVEVKKDREGADVVIEFGGRTIHFSRIDRKAADAFGEVVRQRTRRYPQKSAELLRLERMVQMVHKGTMTQAEMDWDAVGILGPPDSQKGQ